MQKKSFLFKKIHWLLPLIVLIYFSSCSKKKNEYPTCVKLTKSQIQKWINEGYLNPQDTTAVIRFKSAYAWPGILFKIYAGVQKSDGSLIDKSIIELAPVDTCNKDHIKLSNFIFCGTVQINFSDWKISDGKGSKGINDSLEYIQLEPIEYDYQTLPLMAYNDYVVKKGGRTPVIHVKGATQTNFALPCPPCPNCKSPCPPPSTCTSPCNNQQIDSTQ